MVVFSQTERGSARQVFSFATLVFVPQNSQMANGLARRIGGYNDAGGDE
jgi:hypothetical protein